MKKYLVLVLLQLLFTGISISQKIELSMQRGHGGTLLAASISKDGKYLVTAGGNSAILWDIKTKKQIREFADKNNVRSAAFSPDGKYIITVNWNGTILWWNYITGEIVKEFNKKDQTITNVNIIAGGKYATVEREPNPVIYDLENGQIIKKYTLPDSTKGSTRCLFVSDDLTEAFALKSGYDYPPLFCYFKNDSLIGKFQTVYFAGINPFPAYNELYAVSFPDKKMYCIEISTGTIKYEIPLKGKYSNLSVSPDRKYAAVANSDLQNVCVYDLEKKELILEFKDFNKASYVKFLSNNRLFVGSFDIAIVDIPSGKEISRFAMSVREIKKIAVSENEQRLTSFSEGAISIWDLNTGRLSKWIGDYPNRINDMAVNKVSNNIYLALNDSSLDVINGLTLNHKKLKTPFEFDKLDVSTDEKTIIARNYDNRNQYLGFLDLGNEINLKYKLPLNFITAIAFKPNSKSFTVGYNTGMSSFDLAMFDEKGTKLWRTLQGYAPHGISWNKEGTMVACAGSSTNANVQTDLGVRTFEKYKGFTIESCLLAVDSKSVYVGPSKFDNLTDIYQLFLDGTEKLYKGHSNKVNSLASIKNGDMLISGSADASIRIWDTKTQQEIASMYSFKNGEFATITPDGYYSISRKASEYVAFIKELQAFTFENFDLIYNRPDIIAERLGCTSPSLIAAYKEAYKKRLRKAGFTEQQLTNKRHLPEVLSINPIVPIEIKDTIVNLTVKLRDTLFFVNRLMVYVNNVPIYGSKGISLADKPVHEISKNVKIPLLSGKNKVQISVVNSSGVESIRETFETNCMTDLSKPDLYLLTIGVSNFKENAYNLTYASKDADDIKALFNQNTSKYRKIHNINFNNENALKNQILQAKTILSKTRPQDLILVFVASHGLLSSNFDYYLATHDMNFSDPAKFGLAYDELESLIDNIPAQRKTVFIDACHSGEVDKEDSQLIADNTGEQTGVKSRGFTKVVSTAKSNNLGLTNSFSLMQELFANLERGSGAVVISSASGKEYAYESSEWNNGVFTFALIEGIRTNAADSNKDGNITVSEIKDYVTKKVLLLTNGMQTPTSRKENLEFDFDIW